MVLRFNLHHIGQADDSSLVEIAETMHQNNTRQLHIYHGMRRSGFPPDVIPHGPGGIQLLAIPVLVGTSKGFLMIDAERFRNSAVTVYPRNFPEPDLDNRLSVVPDWIPEEFREYHENFLGFDAPGIEVAAAGPSGAYDNELAGIQGDFQAHNYPGAENWFPISHINGHSWVVYHRKSGGEVEVGEYDFSDAEFFRGPFPSLEAWMYSYA